MPNTTNFNWATPADTDLVKDGAAAIRTLGNSIDASLVDLKGGTTGQILSKASNTDLDFTWISDATGIQATIFDAKGDLIAATAADTAARLAVGTNGQYLQADSTTATGLKWATVAAVPANGSGEVTTSQSTTSTSYTDLSTVGPSVTLTTGTKALVIISGHIVASGGADSAGFMSFAVSGASTVTANDKNAIKNYMVNASEPELRMSSGYIVTGLTAGSNTFTAKYRSGDGSTYNFKDRQISVVDMGS